MFDMTFRLAGLSGLTVSNCCVLPRERDRGIYVLCSSSRFNVRSEHVDCRVSQSNVSVSKHPTKPTIALSIYSRVVQSPLIVSSHVIQFHGQ